MWAQGWTKEKWVVASALGKVAYNNYWKQNNIK